MKNIIIIILSFAISISANALTLSQVTNDQELLKQLVIINSNTTNLAGIKQVGNLVEQKLQSLGFTTKWYPLPKSMQRVGTLIAERHGRGKRVLLLAHFDTVSNRVGYQQNGNEAKGAGVVDDKGGIIVILSALETLQKAHALDNTNIIVAITGDEEKSGKPTSISRKALIDAGKKSDVALEFEWALDANSATVARRGVAQWKIETTGVEAHSAGILQSDVGAGAIFELARILNTVRTELTSEKYFTFNPSKITGGGDKENVVAKNAYAEGDYRFISSEQKTKMENKLRAIVANHLLKTNAKILFQDGIPAMPPTTANLNLLKLYSDVSDELGYGKVYAVDADARGASDISFLAGSVKASLSGLGPLGFGAHTSNETIYLNSLTMQTKRAAMLIYRLTHS